MIRRSQVGGGPETDGLSRVLEESRGAEQLHERRLVALQRSDGFFRRRNVESVRYAADGRSLKIAEPDAGVIRTIYDLYLEHRNVRKTHISQRPAAANDCVEPGHWEADLVICKRSRPLLVLHERKTRLTLMTRLASKTAADTIAAIIDILARLDPKLRQTMTFDNGGELARHGDGPTSPENASGATGAG